MRKELWLMIIMGIIIVALLGVFIFVPKQKPIGPGLPPWFSEYIKINSPEANQEITSPLKITGVVTGGGWAGFEGQVGTVKLLDYKGNVLAQTFLQATTEWTKLPTSFEATLNFTAINNGPATLVFHNENPSGDSVRDKTLTLPVKLEAGAGSVETMTVKTFFGKNEITGSTCSVVFPVNRIVPKSQAVAKAALEELLKGPTDLEKAQGYFTSIPAGSQLNSISIVNGEARVDFNEITQSGGGSCSMAERVSEINFTLKQFSTIKSVKISVNGQTEGIFQP